MKFIPIFIVGFLLMFCGGLASRVFFHKFVEPDLLRQSQRVLRESGVDRGSKKYEHLFVSMSGPASEGQTYRVKNLEGNIWAAFKDPSNDTESEMLSLAQFAAKVDLDNTVVLTGEVPNQHLKADLVRAANEAIGIEGVDDRLTISEHHSAPQWAKGSPQFLKKFLSFSGVSGFSANSEGVQLEGEVLSREVRERLGAEASTLVEAPLIVNNALSVKAPKSPTFKLESSNNQFLVSGLLPSEASHKSLIDSIREAAPSMELQDEITVAIGVAEPWWLQSAINLIPKFVKATNGSGNLEFWKNRLHLSGEVNNASAMREISSATEVEGRPEDFSFTNNLSVRADQEAEISIAKDDSNRLVLKGIVAQAKDKDPVLAALIEANPDIMILDQIKVSDKVQQADWKDSGKLASEVMFGMENGGLKLTSSSVEITGKATSEEQKKTLDTLAQAAVGSHGTISSQITFPAVEEKAVQKSANIDFSKVAVYFSSGSSRISSSQRSKVNDMTKLVKQLNEGKKLIVGGYADTRGSLSANRRLSLARANAVRDGLIKQGIPKDRLTVKFYGEDTSNVRKNDLWKSRRVELSVIEE